jgi:hypothetical protein
MAQIVILASAESHLLTLFARFEDQSEGLGFRFHGDCSRAFALLAQFPEVAPVYGGRFRRYLLRKWQIGLFYTIESGRVLVHAALDLRQDPPSIRRLLGL